MRTALFGLALLTCALPAFAMDRELITSCVPCHGLDGIGRDAEIPNLAGQNEIYLFNQLKAFHAKTRPHKEMQYMSRHMTEEEMRGIAAYYASLPVR